MPKGFDLAKQIAEAPTPQLVRMLDKISELEAKVKSTTTLVGEYRPESVIPTMPPTDAPGQVFYGDDRIFVRKGEFAAWEPLEVTEPQTPRNPFERKGLLRDAYAKRPAVEKAEPVNEKPSAQKDWRPDMRVAYLQDILPDDESKRLRKDLARLEKAKHKSLSKAKGPTPSWPISLRAYAAYVALIFCVGAITLGVMETNDASRNRAYMSQVQACERLNADRHDIALYTDTKFEYVDCQEVLSDR